MYLYKTYLFKSGANVIGKPVDNDTNRTDWENNHKSSAVKVDEVQVATTTFVIDKSYADFEALIADPVTWADVKYVETDKHYELNLLV